MEERLTEFFRVRMSPRDYKAVRGAIRGSGQDQSDWLRDALLTKANRVEGSGGPG
jgi:hypothetical protein